MNITKFNLFYLVQHVELMINPKPDMSKCFKLGHAFMIRHHQVILYQKQYSILTKRMCSTIIMWQFLFYINNYCVIYINSFIVYNIDKYLLFIKSMILSVLHRGHLSQRKAVPCPLYSIVCNNTYRLIAHNGMYFCILHDRVTRPGIT